MTATASTHRGVDHHGLDGAAGAIGAMPPGARATADVHGADDQVQRVVAAARALVGRDIDGLHDRALGDDLVALRLAADLLEAHFAHCLRRFEKLRGPEAAGAPSTVAWLRVRCRLSANSASEHVGIARHLGDVPGAEEAFADGRFGYRHAAVLARCAGEVGREAASRVAPVLLRSAERLDPDGLRLVTRRLHHCVDPDGVLAFANRQHAHRWVHLSQTMDGVFILDGRLDAEGGATLRTAIDALSPRAPGDDRTAAQRRADGLVELATQRLQNGDLPSSHGQRPHLVVTVSREALQNAPGSPGAAVAWGGPVPSETARRIACDAALTMITTDAGGAPLSVGRTRRTVPPSMRRALDVRDQGCTFPGCDRPPAWTDAHHRVHWLDQGETAVDNLTLLCRRHHRLVHESGWRLVDGADGKLQALPP